MLRLYRGYYLPLGFCVCVSLSFWRPARLRLMVEVDLAGVDTVDSVSTAQRLTQPNGRVRTVCGSTMLECLGSTHHPSSLRKLVSANLQ